MFRSVHNQYCSSMSRCLLPVSSRLDRYMSGKFFHLNYHRFLKHLQECSCRKHFLSLCIRPLYRFLQNRQRSSTHIDLQEEASLFHSMFESAFLQDLLNSMMRYQDICFHTEYLLCLQHIQNRHLNNFCDRYIHKNRWYLNNRQIHCSH